MPWLVRGIMLPLPCVSFSLLCYCIPGQVVLLLFILLGCLIAVLLFSLNHAYRNLDLQYKRTRDDTTELNLLLQQKTSRCVTSRITKSTPQP